MPKTPRLRWPCVKLSSALAILDCTVESEVVELVESGWLWAWNVGSADARRREFRFLGTSCEWLFRFRAEFACDTWHALLASDAIPQRQPAWDAVLSALLPKHDKPFLSAREVKRALSLQKKHFIELLDAKAFSGTDYRRGPGGSPAIDRQSFTDFLKARVIGGL